MSKRGTRAWELPPRGGNPSSSAAGTSPGSFAAKGRIGSAVPFGSPDTPPEPGTVSIVFFSAT